MSQRFHTFRAPAHPPSRPMKRNTLPLPSVSSRKAATRFMRDVTFGMRSLSKPQLTAVALTFTLVILLCFLSSSNNHAHRPGSYAMLKTDCACPLPSTSDVFVEHILRSAAFVAKVIITTSQPAFVTLEILELYRGHIRAVQWPLLSPRSLTVACLPNDKYDYSESSTTEWLLVAGGIRAPSSEVATALLTSQNHNNISVLIPGELKGPGCTNPQSKQPGDRRYANRVVWMTPWDSLSRTVAESIIRDFGNEPLWWRTNDAALEFKDSIRRASNASDANGSNVASDNSHTEVVSSESGEWWLKDGLSVIAACKDRTETLQQAIKTWLSANNVDEVVVVDWSSNPPIHSSLNKQVLNDARLLLVRADAQSQWILSRAYNLAARSASFSRLLKVDCDTVLTSDFFNSHELKRDRFLAGDWHQLESGATNALHTNGLLYVYRDDFLAVGGFDERITSYGWDDSDLAARLAKIRSPRTIAHDKVHHISHSSSLRMTNQALNSLLPPNNPFAAAVEIQRNRLLLTKYNLPTWRASSSHVVWNVRRDKESEPFQSRGSQGSPGLIRVKDANEVTAASALVSDADAEEVAKRSVRLILRRLGLHPLPRTLTLDFYKTLITKVANPNKFAEVVLLLRGGCMSKLLAHVSSKEAAAPDLLTRPDSSTRELFNPPPYPYVGWRLEELWLSSDKDCSCTFTTVFDARNEEILSEWFDSENHIEATLSNPMLVKHKQSIADVLSSFSVSSAVKNVTADVAKWHQTKTASRILLTETYCSTDPVRQSRSARKRFRESLAQLVPSELIMKRMRDSIGTKATTILDSPLLDIQKQGNLISETTLRRIRESLISPELEAMLSKWDSHSVSAEASTSDSLERRVRAVMFSAYLIGNVWDKARTSGASVSKLESILAELSGIFETLFLACPASPHNYIEAYPELAVVIAGLFSAQLCL